MNLRNIGIVYRKELRDLLRDRRTIMSMVMVPVVITPLLLITTSMIASKVVGQARQEIPRVMVLGGEDSSEMMRALRELKSIQIVPPQTDFTNLISDKKIRAAIQIPKGFDEAIQKGQPAQITIFDYDGELKSIIAAGTLEEFFHRHRDAIVSRRMAERHVDESALTPFAITRANVASARKVTGNLVGMILPYMVILMCMTGAIYPSVDLTAGEKERGTMETLLCSPVARTHLVLGKGLVVLTVSLSTAIFSLTANGASLLVLKHINAAASQKSIFPMELDPGALCAVCLMVIPLAIFFSAALLAIGLFARGSREANTYLQPLLIFTILPAIAAALPGVELNFPLALIPIFNVSLASKEILTGTYHWNYLALVFVAMCGYASLAVAAAVALFKRENVLFRT